VTWTGLGYPEHITASVRDLWAHQDLGSAHGSVSADVPSHGVVMLKIVP
jgi:alpha-galactosidase